MVGLCGDRYSLQRRRPCTKTQLRHRRPGGRTTNARPGRRMQYGGLLQSCRRHRRRSGFDRYRPAGCRSSVRQPQRKQQEHPPPVRRSRSSNARCGMENREYASFLSRSTGHFDTVMMLAVLHHLLLRNQIPMDRIATLCTSLTTQHLILEWVPPSDPKFQELLRGRDAIYTHVTEAAFRDAFAEHLTTIDELA